MGHSDFTLVLDKIREKVVLSEIVMKDIPLHKKGREYVGQCPFHHEKTASFFVNDDKGTYYCFGCGASGNIFDYMINKHGMHFMQAVENLANIAGIKLPEQTKQPLDIRHQRNLMLKTSKFFESKLSENKEAKKYCLGRGLNEEIIKKFILGYSTKSTVELLHFLKDCGFSNSQIAQSGLFFQKNNGELTPRFIDRLMFPVIDRNGWTIGFGGRSMNSELQPKYLNSPETVLFQKKEILYGYNFAQKNVNQKDPFIVVEGYMDVIMMHQYGFNTSVASMGTSFSQSHLASLWKYSDDPIICLDGDAAGKKAMVRILNLALPYLRPGKSLKFCCLKEKDDPDSFLRTNGALSMKKLLDSSDYLIDFLWKYFLDELSNIPTKTPEKISAWKKNIYETLSRIEDNDICKLYKDDISSRIYSHLKKTVTKTVAKTQQFNFEVNKEAKKKLRQTMILGILTICPSVIPSVLEQLVAADFVYSGFNELKNYIASSHELLDLSLYNDQKMLHDIKSTTLRYFSKDNMDETDIIDVWCNIYNIEFSTKPKIQDLKEAQKECSDNLETKTWERLKAIKLDLLNKKK